VEGSLFYPFVKRKDQKQKMKTARITKASITIVLCLATLLCLFGCNKVEKTGVWESATYLSDKEFGNGATTVQLQVKADDKSVTFTIHTDKKILGDALIEHKLIEGEQGAFGIYIKKVNGILADFDVDGTYWALYKDGEMLMTGADSTAISDGEHYEFVRTK
jgi:hypothetical protein